MIFNTLRSYRVEYLLNYRLDAESVEDRYAPGYYRHSAVLVGEREQDIIATITQSGGIPISIKVIKPRNRLLSGLSKDYKRQFLMAIYFNCAGMSASKALEAVIESDTSAARERLNGPLAIIKRGGSFIEAMQALGAYDESTLAILESGERTGTLKEALKTAVEHLESSAKSTKLLAGVAAFTGIELFFAFSSVVGNRYGLLPHISSNIPEGLSADKLEKFQNALHWAYLSADVMMWGTVALFILVCMGIYAYFDENKDFRNWVDKQVMKVPWLNAALLHSAVGNSFKVVRSLIRGGVHFPVAITIAIKSTRVPTVMHFWEEAARRSENGEPVSATLSQSILDSSDRLLIAAHTNRHQLADSMQIISERREHMAMHAAKRFGIVSFGITILYSTLAMLGSLYVLWIQNEALLGGMKG